MIGRVQWEGLQCADNGVTTGYVGMAIGEGGIFLPGSKRLLGGDLVDDGSLFTYRFEWRGFSTI